MPRGAVLPLDQCWRLVQAWYTPYRRQPDWQRFTVAETETILSWPGSTYWRLRS